MRNSQLINLISEFRKGNDSAFFEIYTNFEKLVDMYAARICRL